MIPTPDSNDDLTLWLNSQGVNKDLQPIISLLAASCIQIVDAIQVAALGGKKPPTGQVNVQGEEQKPLDIISNDIMLDYLRDLSQIAAWVSEEIDTLIVNPSADQNAPYVVCFDPLDGSSNIETNSAIGTIFSVLQIENSAVPITDAHVLRAAQNQVAAGYVLYGPTTLLVLTCGTSVASFILDVKTKRFFLDEEQLSIANTGNEFAINMAYSRFWEVPISTYIADCLAGKTGPRQKDFGMRWTGAMVADVHRLFVRGGIFIYPSLAKKGSENGKLRFLYEANPMAMLVEVAGGRATMRDTPIVKMIPQNIHQRVPVVMGSSEEVNLLADLYS